MRELINHLKEADEQWRKDNAEYNHYCKGQVEHERTVEGLLNQFDDFNNEAKVVEPFSDNYYKLKEWLSKIGFHKVETCPACGRLWDMKKVNACECGASFEYGK